MKSRVIVGSDLSSSKKSFLKSLNKFSNSVTSSNYSIIGSSSILDVSWSDCFRTFIDKFSEDTGAIKNLVLSSIHHLSYTSPHCVELYIRALVDSKAFKENPRGRRASSNTIINDILENNKDSFIEDNASRMLECLNIAGSTGHITTNIIEDITADHIVLSKGFRSSCKINDFFRGYTDDFIMQDCKVLVVDGKIIEVSEIHHILQNSYEARQAFILVATGFSDDVSNTLFVNWSEGKTKVVPFRLVDDVKNINEIKDISVVCNTTPCSSKSGFRLSSINLDEIDKCNIAYEADRDVLRIQPSSEAIERISRLTLNIRKKLEEAKVEDIKNLLQLRLSKLCLRNVELQIYGQHSSKGILEDKLGSFFSHVSRCASQGVIDARQLYYDDYHLRLLPALDARTAIKRAVSDRRAIDNIRAVIKLERD